MHDVSPSETKWQDMVSRQCYMGSNSPHTAQEETYVLPLPCHRMDPAHPCALAPCAQTSSYRLGLVEPGHGAGARRCWRAASSLVAVRSRWSGWSSPLPPHPPDGGSGCTCYARCTGRSLARGRSLSWPIGACTPAGCFGGSPAYAGTRFCALTRAGPFGPRARSVGSLCKHCCPNRGRRGRGQRSSSQDAIGNAIVPSWLGGRRGIGIRG